MDATIFPILALILSLLTLFGLSMVWWNLRSLNELRQTFFEGAEGTDMEELLNKLIKNQKLFQTKQKNLENTLAKLQSDLLTSVQKVGVVRFNPFADGGGNFSFSLALLDGHNSGLVITSMHGREQNRIYSKKIENGKSENQLTTEELQAVEEAMKNHHKLINP